MFFMCAIGIINFNKLLLIIEIVLYFICVTSLVIPVSLQELHGTGGVQ